MMEKDLRTAGDSFSGGFFGARKWDAFWDLFHGENEVSLARNLKPVMMGLPRLGPPGKLQTSAVLGTPHLFFYTPISKGVNLWTTPNHNHNHSAPVISICFTI